MTSCFLLSATFTSVQLLYIHLCIHYPMQVQCTYLYGLCKLCVNSAIQLANQFTQPDVNLWSTWLLLMLASASRMALQHNFIAISSCGAVTVENLKFAAIVCLKKKMNSIPKLLIILYMGTKTKHKLKVMLTLHSSRQTLLVLCTWQSGWSWQFRRRTWLPGQWRAQTPW